MKAIRQIKLMALSAVVLLFAAQLLTGQTTSAQLSGTVLDPTSAVVVGAKVTLRNESTSETRTSVTNEVGAFVFPSLVPGTYRISIEAPGFKTMEQRGIVLTANDRRSVGTITLQLGNVAESVTVEAQALEVQTRTAENSSMLSSDQLRYLSTRGRDVISLLRLIPGVTPGTDAESLGGTFGTFLPAVNGQSAGFNQVTLDGQSGTDVDIVGSFNGATSMDAIAEVKVLRNTYQAEYGRNASAVVNIVSKSGTREFHGSAYWFKRNEALNANNFFNNRNRLRRPMYRHDIYGGTIGGPVYIPNKFNRNRDKLFFFYSRENLLTFTPQNPGTVTMPTQLERAGDFSQTLDVSGRLIVIRDPAAGAPFPGNVIPPARINKYGQAILNIFKLPNFFDRSISGGNYNYVWQQVSEVPKKQNMVKIDFTPNTVDRVSVRVRTWWADTRQYNIFGTIQSNWDLLHSHYLFTENSIAGTWTRVLSPRSVNEFTASYRALSETSPKRRPDEYDPITRSKRGLAGLGQWYPTGNPEDIIPQLSFGGVPNAANVATDVLGRLPIDAHDYRYTVVDNFSYTVGTHALKFGVYFEFNNASEGPRGNFSGNFAFGRDVNNPNDSNWAYSNAILGNFLSYTEATNKTVGRNTLTLWEWFAQDSWQATRKLSLEYGVRFSLGSAWKFPDGDAAAFSRTAYDPAKAPALITPALDAQGKRVGKNPVTGALVPAVLIGFYAPNSGNVTNGMVTAPESRFDNGFNKGTGVRLGPRFGFAYDVFGNRKTALRGGAAITRNPINSNGRYSNNVPYSPPIQFNPQLFYGNLDTFLGSAGYLSPPPGRLASYEEDMKTTSLYSWSLSIQHDLGHGILADIAYVGNAGRFIQQQQNINQLPYGIRFLPSSADPANPSVPLPDNFLRPYRGYGNINHYVNRGISNYHALQVSVNRRFERNYQFGLAYTWSKAMDDGFNVTTYLDNRMRNYGMSDHDRTHVLTLNFTYALPRVSSLAPHAFVRYALDGWLLSGIATFASGAPSGVSFTTVTATDLTGGGDGQRVNVKGSLVLPRGQRSFSRWFATENVALPAKGDIGNAARVLFRGPGTNNWDLTAFKDFPVTERAKFQLRWEAYNVFNHTQWSSVNTQARFDSQGNQVNSLFGTITGARTPRVMQGSLRFEF